MSLTIVTGFYDLEKRDKTGRRKGDDYIKHGEFVCKQEFPMIIFCDPEYEEKILEYRKDVKHYTKTIPLPLEEFEHYIMYYDMIKKNINSNAFYRCNPVKNTVNYFLLTNGKFYMLKKVIEDESIPKTERICWLDFGLTHVVITKDHNLAFDYVKDKMKIMLLRNLHKDSLPEKEYTTMWTYCNAMYITGSVENMRIFVDGVCSVFVKLLNKGYVLLEEQVMSIYVAKDTSQYDFYYGDYKDCLQNYHKIQIYDHVVKVLNWAVWANDRENIKRICEYILDEDKNVVIDAETLEYVKNCYGIVSK